MNNPFDTLERRFDQIEQRQSEILNILQNRYFEQYIDLDQYCTETGRAKQTVYQKISEQYSFYDQSLYRQAEIARNDGNDKKALRFLQEIVETGKRSRWTEFAERELQFINVAKRF